MRLVIGLEDSHAYFDMINIRKDKLHRRWRCIVSQFVHPKLTNKPKNAPSTTNHASWPPSGNDNKLPVSVASTIWIESSTLRWACSSSFVAKGGFLQKERPWRAQWEDGKSTRSGNRGQAWDLIRYCYNEVLSKCRMKVPTWQSSLPGRPFSEIYITRPLFTVRGLWTMYLWIPTMHRFFYNNWPGTALVIGSCI